MKTNKKLIRTMCLGLIPSLALVAPIASCSKGAANEIKGFADSTYIVGNASYEVAYFSFNGTIKDDQAITVSAPTESFTFEVEKVYTNNTICVKIIRDSKVVNRTEEKLDLTFTCKNADGSVAWTCVLKDYTIVYTTGVTFDENQKKVSANWSDSGGYAYYTYKFELEAAPEDKINVDVKLTRNETGSTDDSYVTLLSAKVTDKQLEVTTKITGTAEGVSKTNFNITISLLDESGYTIYSPLTISNFTLIYMTATSPIPTDAYGWNADGTQMESFDVTKVQAGNNLMLLPALSPQGKKYSIKEGTFTSGSENAIATTIPSQIKTLKIMDLTAVTLPKNAFREAPFEALDLKEKDISYAEAKTLSFGAKSLQFAKATTGTGSVIFHKNITNDTLVALESKMWSAGLTSPNWYNGAEVKTEAELVKAVAEGGNIFLNNDITLTDSLEFEGVSVVLNLYGHTIKSDKPIYTTANKKFGLLRVHKSTLTIFDSTEEQKGTIQPFSPDSGVNGQCAVECWANSTTETKSTLKIFSGTFYGNKINKVGPELYKDYTNNTAIYNQGAEVYIRSIYMDDTEKFCPKFYVTSKDSTNSAMYMLDCDDSYIASGTKFVVSGGQFYTIGNEQRNRYNPQYAYADMPEGVASNWLASTDYKSELISDSYYKVSKK